MIPFANAWPYEKVKQDIYFHQCPACGAENVLLPLKEKDLAKIRSGEKRLLVLPCCYTSYKLIDADEDYVLADRRMK